MTLKIFINFSLITSNGDYMKLKIFFADQKHFNLQDYKLTEISRKVYWHQFEACLTNDQYDIHLFTLNIISYLESKSLSASWFKGQEQQEEDLVLVSSSSSWGSTNSPFSIIILLSVVGS